MSESLDVLQSRISSQYFDEGAPISEDVIRSIIEDCVQSPSAFNLQPWHFMVITDGSTKQRLSSTTLPSNQQRVLKAPASVLILGDTQAHLGLSAILDMCVASGTLAPETAAEWLPFATKNYSEHPTLARDEAIRSCSLAAMSLMLSATDRGLTTCPVGFSAPALIEILGLPERYVPVMWITIGRTSRADHRRRPRRHIHEVLSINTLQTILGGTAK